MNAEVAPPEEEHVPSSGSELESPSPADVMVGSERRVRWVPAWRRRIQEVLPGLAATVCIAAVSSLLGGLAPLVGAPVVAILTGIVAASLGATSPRLGPGVAFVGRRVLQGAIVVLGLGLSLRQVLSTGLSSLPVLLATLAAALVMAWLAGRVLRLGSSSGLSQPSP